MSGLLGRTVLARLGALLTMSFLGVGGVGFVLLLTPSLKHLWQHQNLADTLRPPGTSGHLLGTDGFGRDLAWRLVAGTGVSLLVSATVTAVTIPLGLVLGTIAGYRGGRWDRRISGMTDLIWSFPLMLVAVIMTAAVGQGLLAVVLAVVTVTWAGFARVVRAETIALREREFVDAARVLGTPDWRIVASHIVPNLAGTVFVMTSYYAAVTIVTEAAFSFIGFGAQPPTPSLGSMLADGRNYWTVSIWPELVPGITIAAIILGLNALSDGLRDAFTHPGFARTEPAPGDPLHTGARH